MMNAFDQVALFMVIVVPLLGALLTMFIAKDQPKDAWLFAILVSFVTLVLSLVIFARYDYSAGGFQLTQRVGRFPAITAFDEIDNSPVQKFRSRLSFEYPIVPL